MKDLTINGPARIHFGLFSTGGSSRFGGMGVMVQEPATVIRCRSSLRLKITGKQSQLATELVETLYSRFEPLATRFASFENLPLEIEIMATAPRHTGFGTGTQISLAMATLVLRAVDIPIPLPEEVAAIMNRGHRSAVGSYGFFQGGCLIETGRTADGHVAELDQRIKFPCEWPIVLIRPRKKLGLHGNFEESAFKKMQQSESSNREQLVELCRQAMVPALLAKDYQSFSDSLFDFNRISGEYFSEFQHGAYNGPLGAQIVDSVREFGICGAGQSSWGPCIFAIAGNDEQAGQLVKYLRSSCRAVGDYSKTEIIVARANNVGAQVTVSANSERLVSTP